jgi:uncharacterized protein YjiS (DUF1127 family)
MAQALTYPARSRAAEADAGLVARLRRAWTEHRLYRDTVRELSQLTDRDLADLGVHRSNIPEIARESVYGR